MHKIFEKLKEEFFAVLPPTIFFFVALHIITFVRVLIAKGSHFVPLSTVSIAVASLILGKAVLISDLIRAVNRYPHKPLAYNITWKTAIYVLVASIIHYLERLIDFAREAGGVAAGNAKLLSEMEWPHFWAIEIILCLLMLVYCTAHELVRVIGKQRMLQLFFGPCQCRKHEGNFRATQKLMKKMKPRSALAHFSSRPAENDFHAPDEALEPWASPLISRARVSLNPDRPQRM